jgi:hypothetical protein
VGCCSVLGTNGYARHALQQEQSKQLQLQLQLQQLQLQQSQ